MEGEHDAVGTLAVAAAYLASGDKEQARSTAERAIKMVDAANDGMRRYVEGRAKEFGAVP